MAYQPLIYIRHRFFKYAILADSSDEGTEIGEVAMESESDENWEEISEQEEEHEELENGRSDDDASICS